MSEHNTLEGVLERIVYLNEENNFTVARLNAGNSRDLITIVGNLPGPNPGETLRIKVPVGTRKAVAMAVRNNQQQHRYTALATRLSEN
jgi:hypothetical protein